MPRKTDLLFPKKFLWGVATSAHQVEGGTTNQWTEWEARQAPSLAAQASYHYDDLDNWDAIAGEAKKPRNYISAAAADHYNLYEKDMEIARRMHCNAWRFSVEWSRVEPREGEWDEQEITHYRRYVEALKARDLEPVVTLFHMTLPIWFAEMGGFETRANTRYFTRYAQRIIRALGVNVRYIITINEPEVYMKLGYQDGLYPPGKLDQRLARRVLGNLAYAHNQAADAIHKLNRRYRVSIAKNSTYIYPGDDARLTVRAAQAMQFRSDDMFMRRVVKTCDFLAMNYYTSERVYGYRVHNPESPLSDLGWHMAPGDIQYALERWHDKYKKPIMITENGVADDRDDYRKWWLMTTLIAMQKAMGNGVQLLGYMHWSLLDTFEWNKGFWPHFGLVAVDRRTMKRSPRPSALWYARALAKIRKEK